MSFIEAYKDWVDKILVADGGSEDNTVALAGQYYPKARVRRFPERVYGEGVWRNPEGKHLNFLIDWATEEEADWVILDDCDCRPNYLVKAHNVVLFQRAQQLNKQFIYVTRLYEWMDSGLHFTGLAQPGGKGKWEPSLWAWRIDTGFRFKDTDWDISGTWIPTEEEKMELIPPYCLIHRPWPTQEELERKTHFYNRGFWADGTPRRFVSPMSSPSSGVLVPLPEWARE